MIPAFQHLAQINNTYRPVVLFRPPPRSNGFLIWKKASATARRSALADAIVSLARVRFLKLETVRVPRLRNHLFIEGSLRGRNNVKGNEKILRGEKLEIGWVAMNWCRGSSFDSLGSSIRILRFCILWLRILET